MEQVQSQAQGTPEPVAEERPLFTLRISPEILAYLALLAIGGAMRFWDLGSRALHHDESLHAYFSWLFFTGSGYQHNPLMHGPFEFHGMALVYFLFGDSDYTVRVLPAMFGTALIGLPYFFRGFLGRWGALVTAVFLTFSPSFLYFSRFARNDIFMAFWTLLLAILMWRYLSERKNVYLYGLAAVLALAFTTKETIFIITLIFGSFLFFLWVEGPLRALLPLAWRRIRGASFSNFLYIVSVVRPMLALLLVAWRRIRRVSNEANTPDPGPKSKFSLGRIGPPGVLLLLLVTLTLPQWAATLSFIQGPLGLTLANPAERWQLAPVGSPVGNGAFAVATAAVVFLLVASIVGGLLWNRRVWILAALVFYGIYLVFYSTVFTHLAGVGTGAWQSLGYWIAQQDVHRGSQPHYYYLVIVPLYEFLPLTFAFVGAIYYAIRRADTFTWFLVYWTIMAFILFSLAGEKMPWLSLNLALPLILLGGKFLGELLERIPWRRIWREGGWILVVLVPMFLMVLNGVIGWGSADEGQLGDAGRYLLILLAAGIFASLMFVLSRIGAAMGPRMLLVAIVPILFLFTFRAGWQAAYTNGDVPKEILVYTQTSPEIPQIRDEIDRVAARSGQGKNLRIFVDPADGYQWPWAWYLRDYPNTSYPNFPLREPPDASVVIVNARNRAASESSLEAFGPGRTVKLRWWFPEGYRGLTPKSLALDVRELENWKRLWKYFSFRELGQELGSVEAVAYFRKGLE